MTSPTDNSSASFSAWRLGGWFLTAVALTLFFVVALDVAGRFRRPITVDIGPSTGRYGSGFEDSEETPPTTSRWTRSTAEFDVPLEVEGGMVRFSVRAARYLDDPTGIAVNVSGKPFASFVQARGRQRIQSLEAPIPGGPLNLSLTAEDPQLGLALDWFRIEGVRWSIPAREWTVWILPLGILTAVLISGASLALSAGASAVILLILSGVAAIDPFGFVHAIRDVALPTILVSMLAARLLPGNPGLTLAVMATLLLKGGFLFHPDYFYNDVRQNDRYVGALRTYEGSFLERSRKAQVDLNVGYPRIVAGKKYAFPYSPIFYIPFTHLPPDRDIIVRAIKHVALFTTAIEVGIAFLLARMLLPSIATTAAWLAFAFPILTSRMLYAMWSTLAGHALDLLVILAAAHLLRKPDDPRRVFLLLAATLATFLIYVSSLFNTSAFLVMLALLAASVRWRVIAAWLVAACAVVFGMYGEFTMLFVREIIPAMIGHAGSAAGSSATTAAETFTLMGALGRVTMFGGYGFPLFALAGLMLIAPQRDAAATALKAYALAFLGLLFLRGLSGGLFKDLKEIEFAGPAFAILSAVAIGRLETPLVRRLVVVALIGTGVFTQFGFFETWSRLVLG